MSSPSQEFTLADDFAPKELVLETAQGFAGFGIQSSCDSLLLHPLGNSIVLRKLKGLIKTPDHKNIDQTHKDDDEGERLQTRFLRADGEITCTATSPCGKFVACGVKVSVSSAIAGIRVWSTSTKEIKSNCKLHKGEVKNVAFSPCSKFLASIGAASDNYNLVLWSIDDVASAKEGKALCGRPTFGATTVAFMNRESSCLITAGALESGVVVWKFDGIKRSISSDSCRLGQIRRDITNIVVDMNDEYVYLGTRTGDVLKVSLEGDRLFKRKSEYKAPGGITSLALVPKKKLLLVGGNGSVNMLDSSSLDEQKGGGKVLVNGVVSSIVVRKINLEEASDDESNFHDDLNIDQSEERKKKPLKDKNIKQVPPSNATIKRRQRAARENADAIVATHNVFVGTRKCDVELFNLTRDDSDILYGNGKITPKSEKKLSIVSAAKLNSSSRSSIESSSSSVLLCAHDAPVNDIAFPRNCDGLFATCAGTEIRIWKTQGCAELSRISIGNSGPTAKNVVFAPDGCSVISGWSDGAIRFHSPQSGTLLATIEDCHPTGVSALDISRNGETLLTGGRDGAIRVWVFPSGGKSYSSSSLKASMKEHRAQINSVQFSNSEDTCATASDDLACIIWDLKRCSRLRMLKLSAFVKSAMFHPLDDDVVLTVSNKIVWWSLTTGEPVHEIDSHETSELTSAAIISAARSTQTFLACVNKSETEPVIKLYDCSLSTEASKLIAIGAYAHPGRVNKLSFSLDADSFRLVSCGSAGEVFVWKI